MARHLFVAATPFAFGEAFVGARIAADLKAQGEDVTVIAPQALRPLLQGHAAKIGWLDGASSVLAEAILAVAKEQRCRAVCLVDIAAVTQVLAGLRHSLDPLFASPVPIIGLDMWGLGDTDLVWDYWQETFKTDARVLRWPRLTTVPMARPTAQGAFSCFEPIAPPSAGERAAARAALGIGDGARAIVWPTARWQITREQPMAIRRHMFDATKTLAVRTLAQLGDDVILVHVGPEPMAEGAALGRRYRFLPQIGHARFLDVLRAADLYFGLNVTATSAMSALALGVPAIIGVHSGRLPAAPSPVVRAALAQLEPYPYLMWALGLTRFLGQIFDGNPYVTEALRLVELFDTDAVLAAARAYLRDPAAADAQRHSVAAYRARVDDLPSGVERYRALVAGAWSARARNAERTSR